MTLEDGGYWVSNFRASTIDFQVQGSQVGKSDWPLDSCNPWQSLNPDLRPSTLPKTYNVGTLIKKPWAFIRLPYMNPTILGGL